MIVHVFKIAENTNYETNKSLNYIVVHTNQTKRNERQNNDRKRNRKYKLNRTWAIKNAWFNLHFIV